MKLIRWFDLLEMSSLNLVENFQLPPLSRIQFAIPFLPDSCLAWSWTLLLCTNRKFPLCVDVLDCRAVYRDEVPE